MKEVWKYEIAIRNRFTLSMPIGAKILSAHTQNSKAYMWALVDPEAGIELRHLILVWGGWDVPDDIGDFVGTIPLAEGAFSFHVWEKAKTP